MKFPVEHITRTDPPMRLHIVRIDLTDPNLEIRTTRGGTDPDGDGPWSTTLLALSEMAKRDKLDFAINANFFSCKDSKEIAGKKVPYFHGNWAKPEGVVVSDGQAWGHDMPWAVSIGFDAGNRATLFKPSPKPDAKYLQVVSGNQTIVWRSANVGQVDSPAPRTAVGLTDDGKTLVILCVDGRLKQYSAGMTLKQLGEEMIKLGCTDALNLDGGGSTTMVGRDVDGNVHVLNRPSDGSVLVIPLSIERPIAVGLGFRLKKPN